MKRLRYARRMTRAAVGGFARQEQGSVLGMTIVFALPCAMFVFACYNIGVGLTTRIRSQNVSDAAAYTSSLWQSRFLNYCAYTRRQIIADYAIIGLCTAYDSVLPMYRNIYDAQGLRCYGPFSFGWCYGDDGIIKDTMEITYNILKGVQLIKNDDYNESDSTNFVRVIRKGADAMNKILSTSQLMFFTSVGLSTIPIMQQVVEEADRQSNVDGTGNEFELATGPMLAAGLAGMNTLLTHVEQKAITKDEVWYYTDFWTRNTPVLGAGYLPMFGRGPIPVPALGGMTGTDPSERCFQPPYIAMIQTWSDGLDIEDDGSNFNTKEHVWGIYVYTWICTEIFGNWPIPAVIYGDDTESDYNTDNAFAAAKAYMMKTSLSNDNLEPSSLAIVDAKTNIMPYFMQAKGIGKLLDPNSLLPTADKTIPPSGRLIRSYSRAKAYFSGPGENIAGGVYKKPHLNYARWGAKLAPLGGYGPTNASIQVPTFASYGRFVWY